MLQIILIGIGAGVAAALLFASPIGGTSLALPLFAMTGLPIAIAGLGWTPISAILATVTGGAVLYTLLTPLAAGVFLVLFGGPIVWLVRLALLSREGDGEQEWFPLGRLLAHAALAMAIGLVGVGFLVDFDPQTMASAMVETLSEWLAARPDLEATPSVEDLQAFVRINIAALPYSLGAIALIVIFLDLWLAGIVTRASGRLARRREHLWTASLPIEAAVAFGVALLASFLPFPVGDIAAVFAGTFGCALALVGLAVLHAVTIGNKSRTLLLATTYLLLVFFGFPIVLFAVLGLVETLFRLRAKRFGGAAPPT
jgi:hypothetical protein